MYKVIFHNQNKLFEVYAEHVSMSNIFGFVEVSKFTFSESGQILLDVAEEKLRHEFEGVDFSLIPMQAIVRIDSVKERGTARITDSASGNVMPFPGLPPQKT